MKRIEKDVIMELGEPEDTTGENILPTHGPAATVGVGLAINRLVGGAAH